MNKQNKYWCIMGKHGWIVYTTISYDRSSAISKAEDTFKKPWKVLQKKSEMKAIKVHLVQLETFRDNAAVVINPKEKGLLTRLWTSLRKQFL